MNVDFGKCSYCRQPIRDGEEAFVDPYDVESYVDTFIHKSCFEKREKDGITE